MNKEERKYKERMRKKRKTQGKEKLEEICLMILKVKEKDKRKHGRTEGNKFVQDFRLK